MRFQSAVVSPSESSDYPTPPFPYVCITVFQDTQAVQRCGRLVLWKEKKNRSWVALGIVKSAIKNSSILPRLLGIVNFSHMSIKT